jgi:hypothetical protein
LEHENVIVINRGLFKYPASAFFSLDRNFITAYAQHIEDFDGEKHLALPHPRPGVRGAQWYDCGYADGLSENENVINTGCNSGYAAVNLSYIQGAKEIHLVGYDMDPKDNSQYRFWAKAFDTMRVQLHAKNIKVWNHNINSFITAFERVV